MYLHNNIWPVVQSCTFQPAMQAVASGLQVALARHCCTQAIIRACKIRSLANGYGSDRGKYARRQAQACLHRTCLVLSTSKASGLTRCRPTVVAAQVRATVPVFCGISGCTNTRLMSALLPACLQTRQSQLAAGHCQEYKKGCERCI